MGVLSWLLGETPPETSRHEFRRIMSLVADTSDPTSNLSLQSKPKSEPEAADLTSLLAPQVDRLLAHYMANGDFTGRDVRLIGLDIFDIAGHDGMAKAFKAICLACGADTAQTLSRNWNRIGNWSS